MIDGAEELQGQNYPLNPIKRSHFAGGDLTPPLF
jgi:hypothetical protein